MSNLRVDSSSNPLGIDDTTPGFSWQLGASERDQVQGAYEVQAASSGELLAAGRSDFWDSGKVESPQSINVAYGGKPLASRERAYWRVRVWDASGRASAWSGAAYWEMGLLAPSDWAEARWIGDPPLTAGGDTATVPVARTDNWARLGTMSTSSTSQPYVASLANDGNTTTSQPGIVMWNDGTPRSFPDTLTATWNQSVTLNRAVVCTLDQAAYPASGYGVRDYDIQALVGGQWQTVATVRGNVAGIITSTFNPVTTSPLRLLITDTNDHTYSRVTEFEA